MNTIMTMDEAHESMRQMRQMRQVFDVVRLKVPGYSQIHLTVSIGGTLSSGDTVEDAIIRADQYMYQAKLRKNMVVTPDVVSDGNLEEHESSRFRQKILIIDDSEFNRAILAEVLGGEFDILEAENGKEGLEVLEQYERDISLVLLDIIMPVMDGFEVLGEMVNRNWIDDIPVIMISSEDSENIICRAYEMGVSDYINRPFDTQVVYRRVYNTINYMQNSED